MRAQPPKFDLHLTPGLRGGRLHMNGEPLPGVRAISIDADLGGVPMVHVTFISDDVQIVVDEANIADRVEGQPISITVTGGDPEVIAQRVRRIIERDMGAAL